MDVDDPNNEDEIHQYVAARYICAIELVWKLMELDIHQHYLPITRLAVQLPGEHAVIFSCDGDDEDAGKHDGLRHSVFTLLHEQDTKVNEEYLLRKREKCRDEEVPEFDVAG